LKNPLSKTREGFYNSTGLSGSNFHGFLKGNSKKGSEFVPLEILQSLNSPNIGIRDDSIPSIQKSPCSRLSNSSKIQTRKEEAFRKSERKRLLDGYKNLTGS
jgi:hypothetical protein